DLFEKDLYIKKEILNKKISFHVPNKTTKWRIKTFYEKEPETLEWIDGFDDGKKLYFGILGLTLVCIQFMLH
ncbi:hypothetical protein OAI51_00005, partial [Candidatus Pelagibacter bacterium]|nr:hypothetical protein [Candidatus Pelagibacter bacterium]